MQKFIVLDLSSDRYMGFADLVLNTLTQEAAVRLVGLIKTSNKEISNNDNNYITMSWI